MQTQRQTPSQGGGDGDRTIMGTQPAPQVTSPRVVRYFSGVEFQLPSAQLWESWLSTQAGVHFVPVDTERTYSSGWRIVGVLLKQQGQRRKGEFVAVAEVFKR